MEKPKTILVGLPSGSGFVPSVMVASLLQLEKPLPCGFTVVDRQRIDKVRNHFAIEALKVGADYLFMVDDDNPIPSNTLKLMVEDDKDIVIAPILSRNPNKEGVHTLCAFYSKQHKVDGKPLNLYYPIEKFKDEGPLHRIDAGGTGCVLIKRKVLEKMFVQYREYMFEFGDIKFKKKVKIDGVDYDRRTMGEDVEFCERALKLGFELWLDDRIRPIHLSGQGSVQWKP